MVPPFVGVAVKVTLCPAQILLPEFELMITDGVRLEEIFMVIELEVALTGEAHCASDVN